MRFSLYAGFLCGHLGVNICIIFFLYNTVYCTGSVSEISQDLSLLGFDIVLHNFLKTSVTANPLTQLYLLKDFSLWQHCRESPQSHSLLAGVVTSHSQGQWRPSPAQL